MTKERFRDASEYVLYFEGGLKKYDNVDKAGATKYGISIRFLKKIPPSLLTKYGVSAKSSDDIDEKTIYSLTKKQALTIYYNEFWLKYGFESLEFLPVCNYLFDFSVHSGSQQAIKIAQKSVNAFFAYTTNFLKVDGILGSKTSSALNLCSYNILPVLRALRTEFYESLVKAHPEYNVYLKGWKRRAMWHGYGVRADLEKVSDSELERAA